MKELRKDNTPKGAAQSDRKKEIEKIFKATLANFEPEELVLGGGGELPDFDTQGA